MRCVACNRPLTREDLTPDKPGGQGVEDLCWICRIAVDMAESEGYDPRFKQCEGVQPGLQAPRKTSGC